jgi:UDP-glucose 4-epimerase
MKKTVLITGGLGYLGGRIALALAANKNYVIRLGAHRVKPVLPEWAKSNGFSIVCSNVLLDKPLAAACQGVDYIIHLAALNEIDCLANPQKALQVNSLGTLKLISAAERAKVKRIIYFSTIHVYGSPLFGRITEKTLPRPVHPYAITHRVAEDFVIAAHENKSLTGIVVRLSNGFGAPADPSIKRWTLVINDLCYQAVTQRKLVLKSSGLQNRDFITLTDIARATEHFLSMPTDICDDCIFNLGGESSIKIIDLAEIISRRCVKVLGYLPPIIRPQLHGNEPSAKIEYRIDKLKSTGFSLKANFHEEIDASLRFCKRYLNT